MVSLKEDGSEKDAEDKDAAPRKKASGTRRTTAAKK